MLYFIIQWTVAKNRAATQEAVFGSGSAGHSNKCQQNKGRHRLPAISGRNNPPTTGHAAVHMHDSTATEIASDSQSSKISRTQVVSATNPQSDQSHESVTSEVSEQGTSSTVSDLINKVFELSQMGFLLVHQFLSKWNKKSCQINILTIDVCYHTKRKTLWPFQFHLV